jgi:uncharacterized membrane protein YcaP (DUF421 family)
MGGLTVWQFVIRVIVLYLLVMVALRLMGKREIGQLSVFDFVISVMIAELSTLPMEDTAVPLYRSIISISLLVILQLVVAFAQLKSHRFRHWVDGEPSVLVKNGNIQDDEMKRIRYTMHDLLTQLREKGVMNIADVEFAILETSGKLSVFPKAQSRPVTPRDLSQPVQAEKMPLPLIIDGTPVKKTLATIQRTEGWLREEVEKHGYGAIENVFYAEIDQEGQIYLDERTKRMPDNNPGGKSQ